MSNLTRREFIGGALGACTAAACSTRQASTPSAATNVLVIVLDTVRYDHFVADNGRRAPAIHALAQRGVSFSNAWAASSWSLPSHASIMTGAYPHDHGADWPELSLRRETRTLAEILAARGYVTGGFSSNSAWVTPEYLGRGYLRFQAYSFEDHLRRTTQGRVLKRAAELAGYHAAGRGRTASDVNQDFLEFIDQHADRPFFGYLCHMDVNQAFHHTQLNRPFWADRAAVPEIVASYDRGLAELDRHVAQVFDELERRNRMHNTILVVTSDHGESFGHQNPGDHDPAGHGTSLYPEQTRVPLVLAGPGISTAMQSEASRPVSNKAVVATVCRLLDLPAPWPGELLPVQPGWAIDRDPAVLMRLRYDTHREDALVTRDWYYRRDLNKKEEAIYRLATDPDAHAPVADSGETARLRTRCDDLLRERRPASTF